MKNLYSDALKEIQEKEKIHKIGSRLRSLREKVGISAKDVPDLLKSRGFEIKYSTYMGYENNNSIPNADVFLALCEIFQVHDVLRSFGYGEDMFPSFCSSSLMDVPYFNLIEDYCNEMKGINSSKIVFDYFFSPDSDADIGSIFVKGKPCLKDEIEVAKLLGVQSHAVIYLWGENKGIWNPPLYFSILSEEEKKWILTSRRIDSEKKENKSSAG